MINALKLVLKRSIFVLSFIIFSSFFTKTYADVYTVSANSDTGSVSFRQAILNANTHIGKDTIVFNIAGGSVAERTIVLQSALPAITDPVVIDGTSQPTGNAFGSSAAKIILDGLYLSNGSSGLRIQSSGGTPNSEVYGFYIKDFYYGIYLSADAYDNCIIGAPGKGNVISGNKQYGIFINQADYTVINANYIGIDTAGTSAEGNLSYGVFIQGIGAKGTVIGGNTVAERNLISGNSAAGILNQGDSTVIHGNYIGTDKTGIVAVPNYIGIYSSSSSHDFIGGALSGEGNLISGNSNQGVITGSNSFVKGNLIGTNFSGNSYLGNGKSGVQINGTNTLIGGSTRGDRNIISGNGDYGIFAQYANATIKGNYIGTDINGTTAIPNTLAGVFTNSDYTVIGGNSEDGEGNVISGNTGFGVEIINGGTVYSIVQGNYIGVAADGVSPLGNGSKGVYIASGDHCLIGGTTAGQANIIANNSSEGIYIINSAATSNRISRNSIFCNSQNSGNGGIALAGGSNGNKAVPVIVSASTSYISGTAAANDTIEVFYDDNCSKCEGKTYITTVVADGAGNWSSAGNFSLSASITATATDTAGNTSPFSTCTGIVTGIIDNKSVNRISIFPNPASSDLNLSISGHANDFYPVKVYDVIGNEVFPKVDRNNKNITINVSFLKQGVYILRIKTPDGEVAKSFIKE